MSREDDVKTLSAGLHEFSTGNEWETLGVAAAIAAFVDARIREAMKPSEVAPLEHRPECASWNMSHAGGMQMAATPCNCDLYKRMVAPVQPEATAAKRDPDEPCKCGKMMLQSWWNAVTDAGNEGTDYVKHTRESCLTQTERSAAKFASSGGKPPCSCREIQAADPSRHFKGCARRVEKADAPYRGEIRSMGLAREWLQHHWPMEPPNALVWSLAEVIAAERAWRSAKELEAKAARDPPAAKPPEPSKPAAVGPEPPERVTLYWYPDSEERPWRDVPGRFANSVRVDLVRASAYEKAVELLRSAVERWPSYNVRDDVVAFLRAHDAPPPRHPADKHGDCTQCGGASHDGAC